MIRIKIEKDMGVIAKAVIIDIEKRVLLLKRSKYSKKFAGEMDLPGGHMKENEPLTETLEREVKEETGLDILYPAFFKNIGNIHFFHAKYDSQPIKLSREHTDYGFYSKDELDKTKKFERIAIEILEMLDQ